MLASSTSTATDVNNVNGTGNGGNVCVAVRIRPLIEREELAGSQNCWFSEAKYLQQIDPDSSRKSINTLPHAFDHVFGVQQETPEIYNQVISPIISEAINGFNGTVLCYGQTSSGKTFTLYGNEQEEGIIALAARDLFSRSKNDASNSYNIKVGLLEIYNEKMTDLLSGNEVTLSDAGGIVVPKNLSEVQVFCAQDILENVKKVQTQRKIGETRMNTTSSRSHTILRIQLEITPLQSTELEAAAEIQVTNALLNFVDLAGSEKAGQTGAQGERFREATYINKSLSQLAQVAMQLTSGSSGGNEMMAGSNGASFLNVTASASGVSKKPQPFRYIDYRSSKLTHLLKNSLSGNAFTVFICNVTPALMSLEETLSTLRFAKTAKTIKTAPKPNLKLLNNEESKQKIRELQLDLDRKQTEVDCLRKQLGVYQQFARCKTPPRDDQIIPLTALSERRKTWCAPLLRRRARSLPRSELDDVDKKELKIKRIHEDDNKLASLDINLNKRRRTCNEQEVFMNSEDALQHFRSLENQKLRKGTEVTSSTYSVASDIFSTPKGSWAMSQGCPKLKLVEEERVDQEVQTDNFQMPTKYFEDTGSPEPPKAKKSKCSGSDILDNTTATPVAASRKIRADLCVALIEQEQAEQSLKAFHAKELEVERARLQELEKKFETMEYEYKQMESLNNDLIRAKKNLLEEVELSRSRQVETLGSSQTVEDLVRIKALEEQIERFNANLTKSKEEVDQLKNAESLEIQELKESIAGLEVENKELKTENAELLVTVAEMEAEKDEVLAEVVLVRNVLEVLETQVSVPKLDVSILCELATQPADVLTVDQFTQTDDVPKAVVQNQDIQTEVIPLSDQDAQTDVIPISANIDQITQTDCIPQENQNIQTDDAPKAVVQYQDIQIQTDEVPRAVVQNQDIQTEIIPLSDQDAQTDATPISVNIDQITQTDCIPQENQSIQTDDAPKAVVQNQDIQTDDAPRAVVQNQDIQTEVIPLSDQYAQTDVVPISVNIDQITQTLCIPQQNQNIQTDDEPKPVLANESVQTEEILREKQEVQIQTTDVTIVSVVQLKEQQIQTDEESKIPRQANQNIQTDTPPRPLRQNKGAQTDPGLDISTRYRDLVIRYKTHEARTQKERENFAAEIKKFEKLLAEVKETNEVKNEEIMKLKDNLTFMKTEQERNRVPKNYMESEIQCNYMTELIERARTGEHGLLPPGFPDISKMVEDNKRLTQEVFLLKAKNAKYNSNFEPIANIGEKRPKFSTDWLKPPLPSVQSSPRLFENKMPSLPAIHRDMVTQPTQRRTPSVIHTTFNPKPQPTNIFREEYVKNDSVHSNSRTDSFKLPCPKSRVETENGESSSSSSSSANSKFVSPAPGLETVIEVPTAPQKQLQRETDIFKEITENCGPTSVSLSQSLSATSSLDKPRKVVHQRLPEKEVVETDEDDFADEIERMLGMK